VVDEAGYALIGEGATGIMLENRFNVTIKNMQIIYFGCGVALLGQRCQSKKLSETKSCIMDLNTMEKEYG
jgi:hypothetical protein